MDFQPSVYEHAAALIARTPYDVSRDEDLLVAAHVEAFRRYRHAPVVVGIDIYNLEPETYGAVISRPDGYGIPAVSSHPCAAISDIMSLAPLDPRRCGGRIGMAIRAAIRIAASCPDADVRIPVSGPFSLACNLAGFDVVLGEMVMNPELAAGTLLHLTEGQASFCRAISAEGLGIALFESGATPPLISPAMFAEIELPALKRLIDACSRAAGRAVPCIIGGDTLPILDSLLESGTGYVICPSETDQAGFMRRMDDKPEITVRINTDPGVYLAGNWTAVQAELERVLRLAGTRNRVCIGTGVLPFESDPDMVLKAKAYVESQGSVKSSMKSNEDGV